MCDHLFDLKSWKHGDPKPIQGISYATATRHLRMLRRRIEGLLGKSARRKEPPWQDLSRNQWDLLWTGEEALRKYGTTLWESGHKTVALFSGASRMPVHNILRQSGDGTQTRHAQVPFVKHIPTVVRQTMQAYLNLVDWEHLLGEGPREAIRDWSTSLELTKWQERHNITPAPSREMGQRITDLTHEPAHQTVLEELEEIKELLDKRTPIT
jgi:hypothetical protein